ncbi:MAG: hypothetical protein IJ274_11905 [Lachnospiraceae bacterium]|nr:hypothetical protein [Lachnospiraceae bacterium]
MNYTFQRVASHCGLRLSYYITATLLILAFLVLIPTEHRSASPLYILLMLAVLPSLLKSMLFSGKNAQKKENNLAFPLFCKKFHYDSCQYKAMSLSYFLLFILFAAWHISYAFATNVSGPVTLLPAGTAAISLLSRILGTIGYRLYFHLFPLKAMH